MISSVVLHLLRVDATLDEVIDTRVVVEELVAEFAANRSPKTRSTRSAKHCAKNPPETGPAIGYCTRTWRR